MYSHTIIRGQIISIVDYASWTVTFTLGSFSSKGAQQQYLHLERAAYGCGDRQIGESGTFKGIQ